MVLTNLRDIKELLDRYGLAPKKGYGQNFLVNPSVPERIAEAAASSGASRAIEIGPGLGTMTQFLSEMFDSVTAVEIDNGLIPLLGETLADCDNVTVINEDFMKCDIASLVGDGNVAVCANLPYYITTPILMRLVESFPYGEKLPYRSVTVMIQTEVADRLCAKEGSGEYGSVTAELALRGTVHKILSVSPGSFYPPPKVSSAVVQFIPHENGINTVYPDSPDDCEEFGREVSAIITAAFLQRRKTLVNAVSGAFPAKYPKNVITAALEECGLSTDVRGERLSAEDFCKLTDCLRKAKQ